jgi:iron(III) transport system permease protein
MATVSGVAFLCGPATELASVAVLNMDDADDIAAVAARAMMIFYTNVGARVVHAGVARWLDQRTQAWRRR